MGRIGTYLRKKQWMKIKYMMAYVLEKGGGNYLKRNHILGAFGEGGSFQTWKLPNEPKLLRLGNNVIIAADGNKEHWDVNEHAKQYWREFYGRKEK